MTPTAQSIAHMTAANPRIVLLGVHRWRRQRVLQLARNCGFVPIVLLYEREAIPPSFQALLHSDQIVRQSLTRPRSAREIAESLSTSKGDWFVLGLDDYVCEFAAELSAFSKKPTMCPSAALQTLEKHSLRRMWNRLCKQNPTLFPVPFRYRQYDDTHFQRIVCEDSDPGFSESRPLIVKPDALDASIAIQRANSWASVDKAIDAIREEVEPLAPEVTSLGIRIRPGITVEHEIPRSTKFHAGAEFSAEFITAKSTRSSHDGHQLMGITQKYISRDNFVEVAHCFPSETFPKDMLGTVRTATGQLLDELGARLCISHWEYVVTEDDRLALVEAQLRPAGDSIMNLISEATDESPYNVLFRMFKTDDCAPPDFSTKRIAAVFFAFPEREVHGPFSIVCQPEAKALRGRSLFIEDEISEASKWQTAARWHSRFVSLIATGSDLKECRAKCEKLLTQVMVVCRDDSSHIQKIRLVLPQ